MSELSDSLPEFCLHSRALNTQKKYRYAYNSWHNWCMSLGQNIKPLPASDYYVALYLVHLTKTNNSSSKIHEAVHAISWAHKLAGYSDPCHSSLVTSVKEVAIRMTAKPVCKKEPITHDHLSKLVTLYKTTTPNLSNLRILTMCLLSYAGFLRFSELVNIKRSHIVFHDTHITLFIPKSKTDTLCKGNELVIAKTGKPTCPVSMLHSYLISAEIAESDDCFIFRSLSYCKRSKSYKLRGSAPISYTRAREILLDALGAIGLDKQKFGLHSLRSGGASAAANFGISDRLFKKHGRWRSETAKDGYVKENLSEKLSVSKMLGI